jgi:hypothetical protein
MDAQTNIHQQYEDHQEDSIRIQQRLEANISKTLTLHAPVKLTCPKKQYIDAFPLTECDRMCSPFKPVIKLEVPVHSNREHFSGL